MMALAGRDRQGSKRGKMVQTRTVPQTLLDGSATNTALGGKRLDLHSVAKFS
jgi:hypothetical protein